MYLRSWGICECTLLFPWGKLQMQTEQRNLHVSFTATGRAQILHIPVAAAGRAQTLYTSTTAAGPAWAPLSFLQCQRIRMMLQSLLQWLKNEVNTPETEPELTAVQQPSQSPQLQQSPSGIMCTNPFLGLRVILNQSLSPIPCPSPCMSLPVGDPEPRSEAMSGYKGEPMPFTFSYIIELHS